jgi:hypothetical protein
MLRVDLEAAGIPYETDSEVADFHVLRAAYVSNLVPSGASVAGMTDSHDLTWSNEKPLVSQGRDGSGRIETSSDGIAPCRTRTYNPLIKSQLLCQLS